MLFCEPTWTSKHSLQSQLRKESLCALWKKMSALRRLVSSRTVPVLRFPFRLNSPKSLSVLVLRSDTQFRLDRPRSTFPPSLPGWEIDPHSLIMATWTHCRTKPCRCLRPPPWNSLIWRPPFTHSCLSLLSSWLDAHLYIEDPMDARGKRCHWQSRVLVTILLRLPGQK